MKSLGLVLTAILLLFQAKANEEISNFNSAADDFFSSYVDLKGSVDYQALYEDQSMIEELTQLMATVNIDEASQNEKLSFLVNSYNVLAIKQIVRFYPVESPQKIKNFFTGIEHEVAGRQVTLDELEKEYIYETIRDGRLHMVLVCAAKGCPDLNAKAYVADGFEQQITERTTFLLEKEKLAYFDEDKNVLMLSELFKWYNDDFSKEHGSVIGFINAYSESKYSTNTKFEYFDYDWSLNDKKN